jgi:hypothetical protein
VSLCDGEPFRASASASASPTPALCRAAPASNYPILTPDEVVALAKGVGPMDALLFHPLMGGMDPELSWASLELIEKEALPRLC